MATFKAMDKSVSAVELSFQIEFPLLSWPPQLWDLMSTLTKLCERFFNDTFLVDQNACSSPNILFWAIDAKMLTHAKTRFWTAFAMHLDKKYQIEPTRMIDKHLDVMTMVETLARPLKVIPLNDVVWRFNDSDLGASRLRFGNLHGN